MQGTLSSVGCPGAMSGQGPERLAAAGWGHGAHGFSPVPTTHLLARRYSKGWGRAAGRRDTRWGLPEDTSVQVSLSKLFACLIRDLCIFELDSTF